MQPIIHAIGRALFHAGGFGLLALGIFDSSPLVVPLGNDVLVVALSARYHERMPYYALMATAGSLIGCFFTDWLSRKSEGKLKKLATAKHLAKIRKLVETHAAWSLVIAALMPPPFPFTAVVAAAAAFRYPRAKSLTFVGIGRLLRFSIEGVLAIIYGRWIIRQARAPWLGHFMIAIIAISIIATIFTIYQKTAGGKRGVGATAQKPAKA